MVISIWHSGYRSIVLCSGVTTVDAALPRLYLSPVQQTKLSPVRIDLCYQEPSSAVHYRLAVDVRQEIYLAGFVKEIVQHDPRFLIPKPVAPDGFEGFHCRRYDIAGVLCSQHELHAITVGVIRLVRCKGAGSRKHRNVPAVLPLSAQFLGSALCVLAHRLAHVLQLRDALAK